MNTQSGSQLSKETLGGMAFYHREQSNDASAGVCGELAIYDEAVTPAPLNRPPLLRRDMLLLHSFKSVAFLVTILVSFRGS